MNKKTLHNLIIMSVTGFSKDQLFLNEPIPEKHKKKISEKIARLDSGEPIEYITNKSEFYGLDFFIDSRVLIPRDDTEVMVGEALREIKNETILIDVGTGSGCIPISVLKNTERISKCFAIDISKDALDVTKINIKKYGLENKMEPLEGSLLGPIFEKEERTKQNIIITANLPYIKDADHENMDRETVKFEPDLALYGGEKTGFELYEKLIKQTIELSLLNKIAIILFIEIGFDQKELCVEYLKNLDLKFQIFKDNGGIERCVKIKIN